MTYQESNLAQNFCGNDATSIMDVANGAMDMSPCTSQNDYSK